MRRLPDVSRAAILLTLISACSSVQLDEPTVINLGDSLNYQPSFSLGDSLLASEQSDELGTSLEVGRLTASANKERRLQMCSTPKKGHHPQFDLPSTDFEFEDISGDSIQSTVQIPTDVSFFGQVYATPKPCSAAGHIISESSSSAEKLRWKALKRQDIGKTLKTRCFCGKDCLSQFDMNDVLEMRNRYWSRSYQSRQQYLLHLCAKLPTKGRFKYVTVEDGRNVCQLAFKRLLRIDKNAFQQAVVRSRKGYLATQGNSGKGKSTKAVPTISWLEDYISSHGDRMPESGEILLPYGMQKTLIYQLYIREFHDSVVSRSVFFKIMADHFPNVKIKKTNSFSKCTVCASLDRRLEKSLKTTERAAVQKLREEHNQRQMLERKYYYSKREASRKDPQEFLSLIIDGMDQAKSNLPHLVGRQAKAINPADLLKTHITGVINHGLNDFSTYIDLNQWPHDPNLTLNILLRALRKTSNKMGHKLPSTLYIQADNCWRENKNKYVLSFCELLVRMNYFHEVHLSFLYVGHTHEDVDAAFSRIAGILRHKDAETVSELVDLLPNPTTLKIVFDIKAWIEDHLVTVSHHTQPLHYRFRRKTDKEVVIHFKGQQHQPWIGMGGSFFKSNERGRIVLPKGKPGVVKPDFAKFNEERFRKQLTAMRHLFAKEKTIEVWQDFLNNYQKNRKENRRWFLDQLPKQDRQIEPGIVVNVPQQLQMLLDKETHTPVVSLRQTKSGQKRRKHVQNRKASKRRRSLHHAEAVTSHCTHIWLNGDIKRHIWFFILYILISNFLLNVNDIFFFHTMLWCSYVLAYMTWVVMSCIWQAIVWQHIGHTLVTVNYSFLVNEVLS